MKTNRLSILDLKRCIPQPIEVRKLSPRTCQEHTMQLMEVWQGNIKVNEYCPACYREQMKEGGEI